MLVVCWFDVFIRFYLGNYSPVGGAGVSCRGTPQVRHCRLDCGHPWPQTPPAGNTGTALT